MNTTRLLCMTLVMKKTLNTNINMPVVSDNVVVGGTDIRKRWYHLPSIPNKTTKYPELKISHSPGFVVLKSFTRQQNSEMELKPNSPNKNRIVSQAHLCLLSALWWEYGGRFSFHFAEEYRKQGNYPFHNQVDKISTEMLVILVYLRYFLNFFVTKFLHHIKHSGYRRYQNIFVYSQYYQKFYVIKLQGF
jgi:hypothetical protein